jgi:predicted ester cyclase
MEGVLMNIIRLSSCTCISASLFSLLLIAGCAQPEPAARLGPLVDGYVRAWNTGEFTGLEEIVSNQFELRMTPRFDPILGLDSLKKNITKIRAAYPDFHISLDEVIYAPDAVTARWTIRATNSGPGERPPTGKTVVVPGMSIIHISGGKITDEWIAGNDLSWAQQLGYTLEPATAGK